MRVVSLLAGGTEITCALGAGAALVGRSHECDNPSWVRGLPQCTRPVFDTEMSSLEIDREVRRRLKASEPLYFVDTERIRSLQPDLLIAQSHCPVCAVTPSDVTQGESAAGCSPLSAAIVALQAGSLGGIYEDVKQIAAALGRAADGEALVARMSQRTARVRERVAACRRVSVAVLEWTAPVFAMGNWGPELVELAGGQPALGKPDDYSAAIDWAAVRGGDPEYLIIAPCGYDLPRAVREAAFMESYPGWRELRAVREGKVFFADGNRYFNRSGVTVVDTVEVLADILHGTSFRADAGEIWRRYPLKA